MDSKKLNGVAVNGAKVGDRVAVDGKAEWTGTLEYVTADGWAGVRQGRGLDEVQVGRLVAAK